MLPPISTVGLTAEDIPALITRVYDQMSSALREMSPQSTRKSDEKPADPASSGALQAKLSTPPAAPRVPATNVTVPDVSPKGAVVQGESEVGISESPAWSASHLSISGSENGAETEEDEGMVLVDRPRA